MHRNRNRPCTAQRARRLCCLLISTLFCFQAREVVAHLPGSAPPYSGRSPIASIERVGNNADQSVEFRLDSCMALRLYAVGEGSRWGMDDYGSLERADTGQVIWQMYYFETEQDGRMRNRRVDRRLTLPAGTYRLRFRTNETHAYEDWDALLLSLVALATAMTFAAQTGNI